MSCRTIRIHKSPRIDATNMKAALLVFGLALVTGQQFQENYEQASTAVVLANRGHFQRRPEDFKRRQFSNNFQDGSLRETSNTRLNLQSQNYRSDRFQQNGFGSSFFRSNDADRFQNFDGQLRADGFRQGERYGRYQGDQRRPFQQNSHKNVFQQNNQGVFQQRYQDDQFQRDNQQNRFSQNNRENRFRQASQEDGFQLNRPGHFHLNNQDSTFQQNNQDSRFNLNNQGPQFQSNSNGATFHTENQPQLFQQNHPDNQFNPNNQGRQFQSNSNDATLHTENQHQLFQQNNPDNQLNLNNQGRQFQSNSNDATLHTENQPQFFQQNLGEDIRPFHSRFSDENNQRNSFGQQDQRFRGSHFSQVNSRFLEHDFDLTSLPAGARFRLNSVDTSFQCAHLPYGFYADQSSGCRVFHVCNPEFFLEGRPQNLQSSFMCGEGFTFDQKKRTCVQEHLALPCNDASNYYFTYDK
ncbi:uncharacterized protein LOC143021530 [Oratosquilla oratoria]|uniref:uncharacterized protein LOC143021530 n=1 Tax=Oratosquilla oratoria TaxID=337810 RepID=UPI003F760A6D